ncbi:c-type cytochrome [Paracoccus marinaquae]|uniref:Cytochrome c n=1 Tax=Paracoccus marinaquae TaxID=2841926 RepID=A0ABS6ADN5_9RHOB|nr:cytochrome c [Paracoccus marinaquae]MBU3028710.1 cytochrome c [Paracoccus marinaquae]
MELSLIRTVLRAGRAVALLLLVAGAADAGSPLPERQAELRHMVRQDCGSCHGLRLTGGLGRAITSEALAGRDPVDLMDVILDGMPGTAMPGWRPLLTEEEARWIADYLLTESE